MNAFSFGPGQRTGAFTPKSIPGIRVWLRADLGVDLNGGDVSAWRDQSGTGDANQNFTQGTAGRQPLFNVSDAGYNGQSTISFTSANSDALSSGTWSSALAQPYTVFVVGNLGDGANQILYDRLTNVPDRSLIDGVWGTGAVELFAGATISSVPAAWPNTASVFAGVLNGASSALYLNAKTAIASGNAGTTDIDGMRLGIAFNDVSNPLNGKIAEVAVFAGVLTTLDRSALLDYFGRRYGILMGA